MNPESMTAPDRILNHGQTHLKISKFQYEKQQRCTTSLDKTNPMT